MNALYHGTSQSIAQKVQKSGLKPRGLRKSNWETASNPEAIYLTKAYAVHFAISAMRKRDKMAAIIEVNMDELDTFNLAPDEDYLEQVTRSEEGLSKIIGSDDMTQRTLWFRQRALGDFSHLYEDSLTGLGNCAYYGGIPLEAIKRIAYIPINHKLIYASDPTITLMNYAIMGPYYRNLMRYVFGETEFEEDRFGGDHSHRLLTISRDGVKVITL
jgi:hypothetical protein